MKKLASPAIAIVLAAIGNPVCEGSGITEAAYDMNEFKVAALNVTGEGSNPISIAANRPKSRPGLPPRQCIGTCRGSKGNPRF